MIINSNQKNLSFSLALPPDFARFRRNWHPGQPRLFLQHFNGEEHSALNFILENLSQRSLLVLWSMKNELKKKGDSLEHIHPLSFFMHILSHPSLRSHYHHLRHKNNKAWREFANGALQSFRDEHQKRNIHDNHIEVFCNRTGADLHHIRFLMHHQRWKEFLNYV